MMTILIVAKKVKLHIVILSSKNCETSDLYFIFLIGKRRLQMFQNSKNLVLLKFTLTLENDYLCQNKFNMQSDWPL